MPNKDGTGPLGNNIPGRRGMICKKQHPANRMGGRGMGRGMGGGRGFGSMRQKPTK